MTGRVLIIGLGLIGGSLAICIKSENEECIVTGYDQDKEQLRLAKLLGIIDCEADRIEAEAGKADLIIVATPVAASVGIMEMLSKMRLKQGAIVTDTGSTKRTVSRYGDLLRENGAVFIGGHPMAGSHKSGVTAAKKILFENAYYMLTPEEYVSASSMEALKEWLKGTKAKFLVVSPDYHDYLTGVVSHFPHLVAASLVHQAAQAEETHELVGRLAAGGFRDITRIASGSPEMWKDIFIDNRDVLLTLLKDWKDEMHHVEELLLSADAGSIKDYITKAKQYRDGLPTRDKGAIPSFYDLFVDVPDYPGVVSEITGYLAREEISIVNIRIVETREGVYGVLVLSFQTESDRLFAQNCLLRNTDYDMSVG
ncbi:prephenate dehydrogenase [Bacillus massilinigeriensis]|uniref:prephenate dehydrogenase n=1 Tax=Bacillus mediterraneensis TaxID=1805474 RepID=UPI0008F89635|nr:prephenate dehydrogenase [Bacillus mediterraneensis]